MHHVSPSHLVHEVRDDSGEERRKKKIENDEIGKINEGRKRGKTEEKRRTEEKRNGQWISYHRERY